MFVRLAGIIILLFFCLSSCHHEKRNHTYVEVPDSSISKGRELAKIYCQSCHTLPDPALADARTWYEGILPQMGPRLGIYNYQFQKYPSRRTDRNLPGNFYPSKSLMSDIEWQHIVDYYCSNSPDSLPSQDRKFPISRELPFFRVIKPAGHFKAPAISMVKAGIQSNGSSFAIADAINFTITSYDRSLQIRDTIHANGPIVDQISADSDNMIFCDIGILNPNDGRFGKLIYVTEKNGKTQTAKVLFDSLRRPVKVLEADLNGDGKKDFLVCEFGNLLGALSWLEKTDTGYRRRILKATPGAIDVQIYDYNHDGLPDIWCLFAQGDESISLFTNLGNGKFTEQQVIRFPPIYGSSSFELDDFNKDGFMDVLYTCGDNADYSAVLKPYHGIYIFMNDSKNHFTQKSFFPLNGAYKAMAKDFDGDGDLDIAGISFFPDFIHQPEESFVYLENQGGLQFKPYSFPESAIGRWLTMDIGDIDADGKADIILGNFSIAPSFIQEHANWKSGPPFIILKNQYK